MSEVEKIRRIIFETEDEVELAHEEINRLGDRVDNIRDKIYHYQVDILNAKRRLRELEDDE